MSPISLHPHCRQRDPISWNWSIMPTIRLDFDVDKPLPDVWQFGLDTTRIPEWQFDISAIKGAAGPVQGVGYRYTLIYRMWGSSFESPVQITRYEPPHTMETSGRTPIGGFFRSTTHMQAVKSGTRVDWQMEYQLPWGFIGKILDFLVFRKAFEGTVRKYNDNFKAVVEGRRPPHPTVREKELRKHPA